MKAKVSMFLKAFYNIKPLIPRRLQIAMRRLRARVKLLTHADIWPVQADAAKPPENWTGWPNGKKFAFVLTHDVDTAKGQERSRDIADLERRLGFISSFNFVPERYKVSEELRNYLNDTGFEIGVHGLNHDGRYFNSRTIFRKRADKINRYIRDWGAVGYRSPSMLHNLAWLDELDIQYDSSTFDTDPFEPQPDGVGTIYPFWVPSGNGKEGFVEIPYTLPQDFTLFVIMRQKNIDLWKRKLDWIASKGGMVLMLTHPDYMYQGNSLPGREEYPIKFYSDFLEHVKKTYGGEYYHVLPKDLAKLWKEKSIRTINNTLQVTLNRDNSLKKETNRQILNVAMISYSFYESDARVARYAETLARRGDNVDIFSLRQDGQENSGNINGVNVFRIQQRERNEKGKLSFLGRLSKFFIKSSVIVGKKHLKAPYDLIHVHSVPDFEVFATLLPKLFGAKIILDIHDIVPEFYASKFGGGTESTLFKILLFLEKISVRFADHVIISNHIWEKALVNRSVASERCSTILNYPDPSRFYLRPPKESDGKIILIYPGSLNWHQGLDIAIKAFHMIRDKAPEAEFHIYGSGGQRDELVTLVQELGMQDRVFIKNFIPLDRIVETMAAADIGVVPKRNDPFGGEAFSTKILELMTLGVPAIVSRTKIDTYYFNDSVVKFFTPEDVDDLADSMLRMVKDRRMRKNLAESALKFAVDFSWENRKWEYICLVDRLTCRSGTSYTPPGAHPTPSGLQVELRD